MGATDACGPDRRSELPTSFVTREPAPMKGFGLSPCAQSKDDDNVCDFHLTGEGDQLVPIHIFPTELHGKLRSLGHAKTYDWIHASDLGRAVDALHKEQDKSAMLRKGIMFLAAFSFVFLATVLGLTFLVLDMSKEIRTKDNVLLAGNSNKPVMVSSVDMQLMNGALFPRGSCTQDGQCGGAPVQVGMASQAGPLSAASTDEELASLRSLTVTSEQATLHCQISGFARFKEDGGDLVVLFTDFGDISVRGDAFYFPPESGKHRAFERAGFMMNGAGRRSGDSGARQVVANFVPATPPAPPAPA